MGKVLIVDDESAVLGVLRRYLGMKGFQTLEAETGEKALQLLASEQVSTVLLDMHLNNVRGLELLGRFLASQPMLKVILMSGSEDEEQIKSAVAQGAYGYIRKPFDFSELEALLKKSRESSGGSV